MAWDYSDKTKQLFEDAMKQKQGTHLGEIKDADAVGEDGSIVCGDAMKLFFNVAKDKDDPTKDQIIEVKYQTFGCTSAIASSEALCQIIEEKRCTPIEALQISNQDIVDHLGGLPSQKIHCSVMGAEALGQAVKDWARKRNVNLEEHVQFQDNDHLEEDEGTIVCSCFNLTEPFLRRKINELNLKSVDEVKNATKAGGGCGSCIDAPGGIRDILNSIWGKKSFSEKKDPSIPKDLEERISTTIENDVRPALKLHGGDIDIIKIKGLKVYCELEGACSHCAGAAITLENVVSKKLKELVHPDIVVINL